jgi:hypothetical protein
MTGQPPPGLIVAGSAVILTGAGLEIAHTAALIAERNLKLRGVTDTTAYQRLAAAMRAAMSSCPRMDAPKPTAAQTNRRWLTTRAAAELLVCTERHARRLAPMLDGDYSTGRWLIPEDAVLEHMEGSR